MSSCSDLRLIEAQAEENMKRCAEILHCKEQIKCLQERLEKLKTRHRDCLLKASLSEKADIVWGKLSAGEKWKKQTVLASLQSKTLPPPLTEPQWQTKVPWYLRYDRDLFLARLERNDFASCYLNTAFKVPPCFLHDKNLMIKLVQVYPEIVDEDGLSEELLDDPDIFMTYLHSSELLSIHKFSERIRNDPKLMLQVVEYVHGSADYFAQIGSDLRSDKQFALRAARKVPKSMSCRSLQFLSQGLRQDKEVVLAFVRKQGGNLEYASYALHSDQEIIDAACQQDPSALSFCLHTPTEQALTKSKPYMLDLLSRAGKCKSSNREVIWEICDPALKNDRDIVVAAIVSNCLPSSKVSEECKVDGSFWEDLLRGRPSEWRSLPPHLRSDLELASLVVGIEPLDSSLAVEVIQHCPKLLDDRQVAVKIAQQLNYRRAFDVIFKAAPRLKMDREFVLIACQKCLYSFELVDRTFMEDREILQAVLQYSPMQLSCVPGYIQRMCPDLVAKAIRKTNFYIDDIMEAVDEALWTNREVALAWASQGGGYLDDFPREFENDRELFLLIAAQRSNGDRWCASEELRNDKEYMLKAVEINGGLLQCVGDDLKEDFDLALVAFAGTEDLVDTFDKTEAGDWNSFPFLAKFAKKVRNRLETHKAFAEHFLFGVAANSSSSCQLSLLNRDPETSTALKQLIAEFLDVPIGKELRLLRQASVNLARWGF